MHLPRNGARAATLAAGLAATLLVAACTTSATEPSADGGVASDTSADAGAFHIAASNGPWSLDQDVSFKGAGANELGAISLAHGVGTIDFAGKEATAFLYTHTPVPVGDGGAFNADVDYEVIAAQADRLISVWITCAGSSLAYVYYESTDGLSSKTELPASGACGIATAATTENVALPAIDLAPPKLVPGFTITGADLSYDGVNPGSATLQGRPWALYPYNVVDCATCSATGWQELHSLLVRPSDGSACLGILYLQMNAPNEVQLAYLMCLPGVTGLTNGAQQMYSATFTLPH